MRQFFYKLIVKVIYSISKIFLKIIQKRKNIFSWKNEIHKLKNLPYQINFLWGLLRLLKRKQKQFPNLITRSKIRSIFTLNDFDEVYTSRAHGFKNAQDYYTKASSLQFLESINTPVLILNALNDSFLSKECFPYEEAKKNTFLYQIYNN